MLPDSEHYKLRDVKEAAMSHKLKYLDVLCFPTLFPSGRFVTFMSHCCHHGKRICEITPPEQGQPVSQKRPVRVLSPLAERDARNLCRNIQHAQEYTAASNACGRVCRQCRVVTKRWKVTSAP